MSIGRYTLKATDYEEGETPNYIFGRVRLEAYRDGDLIRIMLPERRLYKAGNQQTTTEVELYSTPREDLYVVFSGAVDGAESYEITAHLNPLVWWIWFGAGVMVFGTLITILPDRWNLLTARQIPIGRAGMVAEGVRVK
jgi:cytochrome c-type biogenesis protein CcmF